MVNGKDWSWLGCKLNGSRVCIKVRVTGHFNETCLDRGSYIRVR